MTKPRLLAIDGGADRDTAQVIASTIQKLRSGKVRAVAFVLIDDKGNVATGISGHNAGHWAKLGVGIGWLHHRFYSEATGEQ
jgi:hypothetical protein